MRTAGVDEAGRGALAGPVVAAAVVLHAPIGGLADSKGLTKRQREALYPIILANADVKVAIASRRIIDRVNIFQATMKAMRRAIIQLGDLDAILVDGNKLPPVEHPTIQAIVKGDQKVPVISAASIVAKVTRDRILQRLDSRFPGYELGRHKGYATKRHYACLHQLGPAGCHRRSFKLWQIIENP